MHLTMYFFTIFFTKMDLKAEHIKKTKAFFFGGGGRKSIIRGFSFFARVLERNFPEKRGMSVLKD